MIPHFSLEIFESVEPKKCSWSKEISVIIEAITFGTTLVASSLPPSPTSKSNISALILENAKKEVSKIHFESKNVLDKEIQSKKDIIEKEIEKDLVKAQKDITELKKNSISSIQKISENIAANIIENISGEKLNESSIKAAVEDISKKNIGKYL